MHGKKVASNFYSDLRNASSSELMKYYYVNCCCSAVTMLIRSSSYATWSTSDTVVSVQLPLISTFFAMGKYSVTWFCNVNAAALLSGKASQPRQAHLLRIFRQSRARLMRKVSKRGDFWTRPQFSLYRNSFC